MKMSNKWWWSIFGLIAVVQLGVLFGSIIRWERTLAKGEVFKIRCEPVDPYDPFRGRYVRLNFGRPMVESAHGEKLDRRSTAYAGIETGPDGFARFTMLHADPPSEGAFIKCQVGYRELDGKHAISLPFDRFFLNEKLAPNAERAYQEAMRSSDQSEAWIELRILNDNAVIENLLIDGRPITEVAREALQGNPQPKN